LADPKREADEGFAEDRPYLRSATGRRLYVDPADERARALDRSGGSMNDGSMRVWEVALSMRSWDVVVDVGANYGEMLLGAPLPSHSRLVCFEPNPQILPHLRRSIAESGLEVDLRAVAVGTETGESTFYVDTVWSGRSGLAQTHRTDAEHRLESVTVPMSTLDSELEDLAEAASVCIKVDVEGGEFAVLAGAERLLSATRPWVVMLEILHMDPFEVASLAATYTMRVLDRRTGELVVVPPATPRWVSELLDAGWLYPQDALLTTREAA